MDCKSRAARFLLPCVKSLEKPLQNSLPPLHTSPAALMESNQVLNNLNLKKLSERLCQACTCGSLEKTREVLLECGDAKKQVINMIPDHDLPSLCCASLAGNLELVQLLLENGAAPVCQRESGLSPIHLACDAGHVPMVQLLLSVFPELAQVQSLELQLPVHIAAAQPCDEALQSLLNHKYPDNLLQTLLHKRTQYHYKACFDINAKDSAGKNPLHIASEHGRTKNIKALLEFAVEVSLHKDSETSAHLKNNTFSKDSKYNKKHPSKTLIVDHMSVEKSSSQNRGNMHAKRQSYILKENLPWPVEEKDGHIYLHPADLDSISKEGLTPLHYAIKHRHQPVVSLLLNHGADPDQPLTYNDSILSPLIFSYLQFETDIMKLLLQSGATDDDNSIICAAFMSQDKLIVSLLLQFRSVLDTEKGFNKSEMRQLITQNDSNAETQTALEGTLSSASTDSIKCWPLPVALLWNGIGSLYELDNDILVEASRRLNPSIRHLNPAVALCAITKIDISSNSFQIFPMNILSLPSLVMLNISKNNISEIPEPMINLVNNPLCPMLEEFHLKRNKLSRLPGFIFLFPALQFLDVSDNKLIQLPPEMWTAPALVTLNLSGNQLSSLPLISKDHLHLTKESSSHFPGTGISGPNSSTAVLTSVNKNIPDPIFKTVEPSNTSVLNVDSRHASKNCKCPSLKTSSDYLKYLNLSKNKFTTLPPCLPCYAQCLEVLDFSHNLLESVGPISYIPSTLLQLDLSNCGLTNLKPWSCMVGDALEVVCYMPSSLSSIPSTSNFAPSPRISSLLRIQRPFSSTMLEICFHHSHTSLPWLEKLNLSHNMIEMMVLTTHPESSACHKSKSCSSSNIDTLEEHLLFPNLKELDLSMNKIVTINHDICEMENLKLLSLRGNSNLRELPSELVALQRHKKVEILLDYALQEGPVDFYCMNCWSSVKKPEGHP